MMVKLLTNITARFGVGVQPGKSIKRFYKSCTYVQNPNPAHSLHRYLIKLDDKSVFTPYRHVLAVPSPTLAHVVATQFNQQENILVSAQMPMLALCRTAVDADIEGNVADILKKTILDFLKTDTLNFYEEQYVQKYNKEAKPLVDQFASQFNMKIEPSSTFDPPKVQNHQNFAKWIQKLNNWQLIGMETMTIWLQSTISAYSIIKDGDLEKANRAANLQDIIQIQRSGSVQEKQKLLQHMKAMIASGLMMFKHGYCEQKMTQYFQSQLQKYLSLTRSLKNQNSRLHKTQK